MKKIYNDEKLNKTYSPKDKFYIPDGFNSCKGSHNLPAEKKSNNDSEQQNESDELELPEEV